MLCFAAKVPGQTTPADVSWNNLSRVSHNSSLTFIKNDGACEHGTVLKVDTSSVTVNRSPQNPVTIQKVDLLQVGEGGPHNIVYSSRSSWSDVMAAQPGHAETLLITMKDGEKYNGKPVSTTDTMIVLKSLTRSTTLMKQNVVTVDYVRQKPLTDGEEYFAQEAGFLLFFSPMTYVRAAGASLKLDVRLYDASMIESNSKVTRTPTRSSPLK